MTRRTARLTGCGDTADAYDAHIDDVRTWHEEPVNEDQHELVHVSASGEVLEHTALQNNEYAEFAPLSQFRMGGDGNLYQLWSDEAGFEVRRFNL